MKLTVIGFSTVKKHGRIFEAFHQTISSDIKLIFMMREIATSLKIPN